MRSTAAAVLEAVRVPASGTRLDLRGARRVGVAPGDAGRTTRRVILWVVVCLCFTGCLPRERLDDSCRWMADSVGLAPPGDPARRAHLIEDVRVAQWLGIRHADVVRGRVYDASYRRARDRCTTASLEEIMRRHRVSHAEITAVTGAREPWIDLLAVFLPMIALFLVVGQRVAARVVTGYDPEDRWLAIASLVVLTPIAAGFALGLTQMWAWLVETIRLRDGHISDRVSQLPAYQHPWLLWGVAMGLFAALAVTVVLRRGEVAPKGRRAVR